MDKKLMLLHLVLPLLACDPLSSARSEKNRAQSNWAAIRGDPHMAIEIEVRNRGPKLEAYLTLRDWSHAGQAETDVYPTLASDTVATVNGQTMKPMSLGDVTASYFQVPQWEMLDVEAMLAQPNLDVKISNSSGSVQARFVNVGTPRTFEIVSPTDGMAHVGDKVRIRVSPSTDRLDGDFNWAGAFFDGTDAGMPFAPQWVDPSRGLGVCGDYCKATEPSSAGERTFTVPTGAVDQKAVRLAIDANIGFSQCDVAHCDLILHTYTNAVPLSVVP